MLPQLRSWDRKLPLAITYTGLLVISVAPLWTPPRARDAQHQLSTPAPRVHELELDAGTVPSVLLDTPVPSTEVLYRDRALSNKEQADCYVSGTVPEISVNRCCQRHLSVPAPQAREQGLDV